MEPSYDVVALGELLIDFTDNGLSGQGNTFCACCLHYVLENGLSILLEEQLEDMLTFANAAASIITTRKGALRVMPTKEEIEEMITK